jgi:hypothetical protein
MEENRNVFDFELYAEEMAAIDALDKGEGGRVGPTPTHSSGSPDLCLPTTPVAPTGRPTAGAGDAD